MATTTRVEAGTVRHRAGPDLHAAAPLARACAMVLAGVCLLPAGAQAQEERQAGTTAGAGGLRVSTTVATDATASSNVGLDGSSSSRSDLVLNVSPRVRLGGGGAGWRLDGEAGFSAQFYAAHARRDKLLPRIDLSSSLRVLDRWLALDSRVLVTAEKASPFGGASPVDVNSLQTTSQLQISPTLDHELSPTSRVYARSENSWIHQSGTGQGDPASNSRLQRDLVSYTLQPRPLGVRLEARRLDSRISGLSEPVLRHDSALVVLSYAVEPRLSLNLRGGADRALYGLNTRSGPIEGAGLLWQPNERSSLEAHAERHFYGTGWRVLANLRAPGLSLVVDGERDIGSYASALGSLLPGGSVADLLDRMLTSRIPDAAQRAAAVQDLMIRRGLPATLARPTELFSTRAELRTSGAVTLGLLGARHVLSLRMYALHTQDLPGEQLLADAISGDARQSGWSLDLNRRLDPQTSAEIGLSRNRDVGLGSNAGRESRTTALRIGATHELSPRTVVSVGARRVLLKATVLDDAGESALYAGALHRF